MENKPKSLGGDLPISRRCHNGEHTKCRGMWAQYPDLFGPCKCSCHCPQCGETGHAITECWSPEREAAGVYGTSTIL